MMRNLRQFSFAVLTFVGAALAGFSPAGIGAQEDASSEAMLRQIRNRQNAATQGATSGVRVKTNNQQGDTEGEAVDPGSGSVAMNLEEGPPQLAGLVDQYAILYDTLQQRAEAQLGDSAETLQEEDYIKILRKVEDTILEEWATNTVLSEVARDQGIRVSREDMEERLNELAEAGGHPGHPERALAEYGIDIRDYITEYQARAEYTKIKELSGRLGLDEDKLRKLLISKITKANINDFGRFDDLKASVDSEKASNYFEQELGEKLSRIALNIRIHNLLQNFIIDNEVSP